MAEKSLRIESEIHWSRIKFFKQEKDQNYGVLKHQNGPESVVREGPHPPEAGTGQTERSRVGLLRQCFMSAVLPGPMYCLQ